MRYEVFLSLSDPRIGLYGYFYTVIRIVLLGNGNVAFHLHRALLAASKVELVQLVGRRKKHRWKTHPAYRRPASGQP